MSDPRVGALADEYYDWMNRASPLSASLRGVHDYGSELDDFSRQGEDRQIAELRSMVERARAIDPESITDDDRVTLEVLVFEAESQADVAETRMAEIAVNHAIGVQALLPVIAAQLPIDSAEHAAAHIERFTKLDQAVTDMCDRLRDGLAAGRAPMGSTAQKTVEQIDALLAGPLETDAFVQTKPAPGADEAEWRDQLIDLTRDHIRPASQRYRDFIAEHVVPAGRSDEQPGLSWLADGEASYARHVRRHTSLPLDPEEIHHIGLRQVAALADEYRRLGGEALGTTDLEEIFTRLRDDPAVHFDTGPDVVAASEVAMAKAKAEMGDWFGRLPKADCVVAEVAIGPTAFYIVPTPDGSRPGTFFVNTADPARWGRFEIEAMAYHEGIPGHHLQLAIAQELDDVPEFRKHAEVTVYAEGWGLYSERLADEMNLYGTPLDRIGMLSADSMRAGRLVVDTGLHAKGWSRQQAIDYFIENSPMSRATIEEEVDRYIGMPGQALAYMIGRLEIMRMRSEAEDTMGDRFDIKGFHDTVLGHGLVPMETLDRLVREWARAS